MSLATNILTTQGAIPDTKLFRWRSAIVRSSRNTSASSISNTAVELEISQ